MARTCYATNYGTAAPFGFYKAVINTLGLNKPGGTKYAGIRLYRNCCLPSFP